MAVRKSAVMPVPSEEVEQRNVCIWLTYKNIPFYAIPNGGFRRKTEAARMKAQGVKSGVPDLCIPRAAGKYHGLYIEMKRERGGRASKEQKEWIELLNNEGYAAAVCKGFDEAIKVIENYFNTGRL